MSGLAGLWHFSAHAAHEQFAARMDAAMAPFGPDRAGLWRHGQRDLTLSWRQRLALPEDRGDRQPLATPDGRLVLVADARIDNRQALAHELGLPAGGDGLSDAAIILAVWQRWGRAGVARLVGDFAFALWDESAGALHLARDYIGQVPLFWAWTEGFCAFASMPRGLTVLPDLPHQVNDQAVAAFTTLLPLAGEEWFQRHLYRVQPGHVVTLRPDRVERFSYWSPPTPGSLDHLSYPQAVEQLRLLIDQAVSRRLRAIGSVGAHLSAGWDSAAIAATAARQLAGEDRRLTAFTAAPRPTFPRAPAGSRWCDEFPGAAQVAGHHPNIDHLRIDTATRSQLDDYQPGLAWAEMPILNICNYAWHTAIARAARQRGIQVMLIGGIGNTTMSWEGWHNLHDLLRHGNWITLARAIIGARRDGMPWARIGARILRPALTQEQFERIRRLFGREPQHLRLESRPIAPDFIRQARLEERALAVGDRGLDDHNVDPLTQRLRVLRWVDTGCLNAADAGRFGIDTRDPTSDRDLVEFCLAVPQRYWFHHGRMSALFRDAMADRLPATTLARRQRGLQAADWYEGLVAMRDQVIAEVGQLAASPLASALLDLPRLQHLATSLPPADTPRETLAAMGWNDRQNLIKYRTYLLRGLSIGRFIDYVEGGNGS